MKINISLELTDSARDKLANLVDGKVKKRLLKRAEVIEITRRHWCGLIALAAPIPTDQVANPAHNNRVTMPDTVRRSYEIDYTDPLTAAMDKDKMNNPGYVRGWNMAAQGGKRK